MLRYLPFLMLIVPLTEIAVFILVGQWIGVLPTIALVILTAIAGAGLLRHQGLGLATKIKHEIDAGRAPGRDLANGAMMLVAGVLLLTPGFVTDTLGFLLFIPHIRDGVFDFMSRRIKFVSPQSPFGQNTNTVYRNETIDLDSENYSREDEPQQSSQPNSNTNGNDTNSPWKSDR